MQEGAPASSRRFNVHVITIGIDLAARPKSTALCQVDWSRDEASITRIDVGVDDEAILEAVEAATRVGVDVPFGWPTAFVELVSAHSESGELPDAEGVALRWRATDQYVFDSTGLRPLSVSTDKIGATALRWARLESELVDRIGLTVDRSGSSRFVEVYPAAALSAWGLAYKGYKGPRNREQLRNLASSLAKRTPFLDTADELGILSHSDHAFDALVSALVARATHLRQTVEAPPAFRELARTEGWIHLPKPESLERLSGTGSAC